LVTADARLALVEDAVATSERVTITRHGRPAAVLISVDDLETMEETLFWQAQHRVHEDIGTARTEAETGQLTDESTVRRRYGIGSSR
jgi:prevent-host-death family protein